MSTQNVRPAKSDWLVLVLSEFLQDRVRRGPRHCNRCGSKWKVRLDPNGQPDIWRNDVQENEAILDWDGNNVVVECCRHER
jgi:hypothetical protein